MKNALKAIFCFLSIAAFAVIYIYMYGKATWGTDDANIYMVYMKNFANGHGFVYNVGGEHVEGFTSLLWCIIGAAFYKVSSNHFPLLLIGLNVICLSYAIYRLLRFFNRTINDQSTISKADIFTLGCLFVLPGFIVWNTFGLLETGFWAALLILAIVNLVETGEEPTSLKSLEFSTLLALMVFTRPESYLWGVILLAIRLMLVFTYKRSHLLQQLLLPVIFFAASMVALFSWRLSYFGFAFPNTYYAKVSANKLTNIKQGLAYLRDFLFETNPFALVIVLICLAYSFKLVKPLLEKRRMPDLKEMQFFVLSITAGIGLLLPISTGGDPFLLNRFYQPVVPVLVILFLWMYYDWSKQINISYKLIALGIVIISFLPKANIWHTFHVSQFSLFSKVQPMPVYTEFKIANDGRALGEKLNAFFKENNYYPSQGVITAGGQAYGYKGVSIDLLGLNNVEMAHADKVKSETGFKSHASFNKQVFYKQLPDLMYYSKGFITDTVNFGPKFFNLSEFWNNSFMRITLKNITNDNEFKQAYKPVIISKKGEKEFFYVFASNAFIAKLDSTNYSTTEIEK